MKQLMAILLLALASMINPVLAQQRGLTAPQKAQVVGQCGPTNPVVLVLAEATSDTGQVTIVNVAQCLHLADDKLVMLTCINSASCTVSRDRSHPDTAAVEKALREMRADRMKEGKI